MYRVVIVEDDPMVSLINRTYVERDPRFQVVQTFQDGRAALDWLEQNPVDLAVLDVYMPLFTGVELLPEAVPLAEKAAARNGLSDRLVCRQGDLRDIRALLPAGDFDLVVSNPPYYPVGAGHLPEAEPLRSARSEAGCTLEEVCAAAAYLLRWGGSFCLVHKPERLADLCCALRASGLEPKRLRLVCRRAGDAPSLLLLEARRGGRPGLDIAAPLCLEDGAGRPTAELDAAYFRTKETNP